MPLGGFGREFTKTIVKQQIEQIPVDPEKMQAFKEEIKEEIIAGLYEKIKESLSSISSDITKSQNVQENISLSYENRLDKFIEDREKDKKAKNKNLMIYTFFIGIFELGFTLGYFSSFYF